MYESISGQWTGSAKSGDYCIANINDKGGFIDGRVSVYEQVSVNGESVPIWTMAYLSGKKDTDILISGSVEPPTLFWGDGNILTPEQRAKLEVESQTIYPVQTTFSGKREGLYKLKVEWTSVYANGNTQSDEAILEKKRLGSSKIFHQKMDWDEFKAFASGQEDGVIYRGQARHWRLRTSFHRTGHADLIHYLDENVPELEKHINAFSEHEFNASDDRSLGRLLNLAQHHGYPTPLLDWTKSPFVAAFFAFVNKGAIKKGGTVSIFCFNDHEWSKVVGRQAQIRSPKPSVRNLELPVFGNQRVLPQQSITMFSNADDIETIIKHNEKSPGQYLTAIALPEEQRSIAIRDLHLMGITWGALFPGVEGVCKQLSIRHFGE